MSEPAVAEERARRPREGTRMPWWAVPVAGVAASLAFITRRVGDPDYWWHELTGQWIVQHHALARADLYTYTVPNAVWTDHEYGSQLLFYVLRQLGGLTTTSIFFALVGWVGFRLFYARIREQQHSPVVTAAALVLAA